MSRELPDLLALKPEPDRYVKCGGDDERPSPMFHLYTLLQYGERVAEEAVRLEREACELIAVSWSDKSYEAEQIAEEIRARSQEGQG